jgi:transcriptional regulator with XRE-family HTH domain
MSKPTSAVVTISMTFGNRLRLRRLLLGWSQKEMAVMLDVSPRAIFKWENGKPPILLTQEAVDARLKLAETQRKKNSKK